MQGHNLTVAIEFFLLGFKGNQYKRMFLFCLFLIIYCGTICGNLLIITLVSTSKNLQTPMYFFISQLSVNEACECFLLAVMSYDRYVAICNPLRYTSIMNYACYLELSITCWLVGFAIIFVLIFTISALNFCGPKVIDHFFCDVLPLKEIACSDLSVLRIEIVSIGIISVAIQPIIILLSYGNIIVAILKISSITGRQKVFSTCSSHLIVVSIFYWTMFSVYVFTRKGDALNVSKLLSLLYTVFTPLINPIIYSLRNKDIREAVSNAIQKLHFL